MYSDFFIKVKKRNKSSEFKVTHQTLSLTLKPFLASRTYVHTDTMPENNDQLLDQNLVSQI